MPSEEDQLAIKNRAVWGFLIEHAAARSADKQGASDYCVDPLPMDVVVHYEKGQVFEFLPEQAYFYLGHLAQYVCVQIMSRYKSMKLIEAHYYDDRTPGLVDFSLTINGRSAMTRFRWAKPEHHWANNMTFISVDEITNMHALDVMPDFLLITALSWEEREGMVCGWLPCEDLLHRETTQLSDTGESVYMLPDEGLLPIQDLIECF